MLEIGKTYFIFFGNPDDTRDGREAIFKGKEEIIEGLIWLKFESKNKLILLINPNAIESILTIL